jgi:hypothetical protein
MELPTPLEVPTAPYDRLGGLYNEHWLQPDVTITGKGSATVRRRASVPGMSTSTVGGLGSATSSGRRDDGIRRKLIASVSAGLQCEPDKGDLQGESNPGEHLGRGVVAVLCGYGGLQVGGSDDHEKHRAGDPGPPVPAPEPDRADELGHPAGVDQFSRPRQNMRNKGA